MLEGLNDAFLSIYAGCFRSVVVVNVLRHLELTISAGDQASLAIATSLLCTNPIFSFIALLCANVTKSVVENFRSSPLTGDE